MTFRKRFNDWKKKNNQHGVMAHSRFVMFLFLEGIAQTSSDFTFKGGNLLWYYIKTPRPTIDIDLSTSIEMDKDEVLEYIKEAGENVEGVDYKVLQCRVDEGLEKVALKLIIGFRDESGGQNKFGIDIILGQSSSVKEIMVGKQRMNANSPENIIIDKLSACIKFGSGNTRAKDYDDLFRIGLAHENGNFEIDAKLLRALAKENSVRLEMDYSWISEITLAEWERHIKKMRKNAPPKDLSEVFHFINEFLSKLL